MDVLVVATWFPTRSAPESGIFNQRDVEMLAGSHRVRVVHVVSPSLMGDEPGWSHRDGYELLRVPMSTTNPISVAAASRVVRAEMRHATLLHSMAISALFPLSLNRVRIPWVHTEHWSGILSPDTTSGLTRLAVPFAGALLRRPSVVVAVSSELANAVRAYRGNRPVRMVPNAIDIPDVHTDGRVGSPTVRLVAVGGVSTNKGADIALETIRLLREQGADVQLEWLGDGPLLSTLRDRTTALGLDPWVKWHGRVPPTDVPAALDVADLFVLPTVSETFGVAIAEALARGVPVVVGARGGQRSFVRQPFGQLVDSRNPADYAQAIRSTLLATRHLTRAEIAASLGTGFKKESRAEQYAQIYAEATALS